MTRTPEPKAAPAADGSGGRAKGRLGGRVALGASVLVGGSLAVRVLGVLSLGVLARLLTPADYGVIALAYIALELARKMSELQIANALVRLQRLESRHYDTAFTLNLLRGALLAVLMLLCADLVAAAMKQPALGPVLRVMAVIPLIDGLRTPRMVDFTRAIDFSREALIGVAAKLLSIATSIALAVLWRDYWALVAGLIAGSLTALAIGYAVAPYRPRLSLAHWRMFIGFGGWLTLSGVCALLSAKMGALLVGRSLGADTLGQYHIGDQTASMATNELAMPLTRAAYSGLAAVGDDPARLRSAYVKAQTSVLALVLPIGVGAALTARELLLTIAGPQWTQAIDVVRIVTPIIALTMVTAGAQALMMVRGDTRAIFLCNFANLAFRVPVLLTALALGGFIGLLWGRVVTGAFFLLSMLYMGQRGLGGEPIWRPFVAAWRSFAACGVMVVAVTALRAILPEIGDAFIDNAAHLAAMGLTGGSVYVATHLLLWWAASMPDGIETTAMRMATTAARALYARLTRRGRGTQDTRR